ncbi:hypothetical protein [Candidatus Erwinia dacicola]|uniref:Uncharacterized protein n=1 Tax=Candidatus Erwinia dacicola TaxID=252393 RepID=A0A328TQU1_9GAMM|nr:hypothetical protein [Candidatus Erwinia dacicola]RAP72989.1 hypothetical protein ACZ87_00176 [Candidatus Erwinia dacicola]
MDYSKLSDAEIREQAVKHGITVSINRPLLTFGDCAAATYPTHGGKGCDSAIVSLGDYEYVDDAINAALREALGLMMQESE